MEFEPSIRALGDLDPELLLRLLGAYNEARLYAAIGWFVEDRGMSGELLGTLETHRPKAPLYLDRTMGPIRKVGRWNLLVPDRLRRMEESDAVEF